MLSPTDFNESYLLTLVTMVFAVSVLYISFPPERFRSKVRSKAKHTLESLYAHDKDNDIHHLVWTNLYHESEFKVSLESIKNWANISGLSFEFEKVNGRCKKLWVWMLCHDIDNIICVVISILSCSYIFIGAFFNADALEYAKNNTSLIMYSVTAGLAIPLAFSCGGLWFVYCVKKNINRKGQFLLDKYETRKAKDIAKSAKEPQEAADQIKENI